ncbi:actin organization and endocytosis protein [Dimargaris cristalligena]|uniref:Actin cytoskeleton-regulatory complex protein PAN1 n=1 Tax=Dimargaris cristalligena TaxID=215637 RepID=A0A4P9ZVS4_9FUNG|nr:actin organization and endocytosis protein [Dimargaris cristalligena]RKP37693.1 hypothetical protein BJ085DRAFT_38196 [Dimargaris cristalligena]|eukprot:RKP37693.1 hypothetical protein BJ085DRAFT_38196 [Dimargaris cristalligena]
MSASTIQISFITPADLTRFEGIFKQNVSSLQDRISGAAVRNVLTQSGLPSSALADLWDLSDIDHQGTLSFPEFALAMFLTQTKLSGKPMPTTLPDNVRSEIQAANRTLQQMFTASHYNALVPAAPIAQAPQNGAMMPSYNVAPLSQYGPPQPSYSTGLVPRGVPHTTTPGPAPAIGHDTANSHWVITTAERQKYNQIFRQWDKDGTQFLSGQQAREVFSQSGLNQRDLMRVWSLADVHNHGKLNIDEFAVAMHLIFKKLSGVELPGQLPDTLLPKSTRDLSDSVSALKDSILTDVVTKKVQPGGGPNHLAPSFLLESDPVLASAYSALGATEFTRSASNAPSSESAASSSRRFKDQDDTPAYVSKSRYKSRFNAQNPARALTAADLEALRKKIKEKRIVLDALKERAQGRSGSSSTTRGAAGHRIAELKSKIRSAHSALLAEPDGMAIAAHRDQVGDDLVSALEERKRLQRDLQDLIYLLPTRLAEGRTLAGQIEELSKRAGADRTPTASALGSPSSRQDAISQRAAALLAERMQSITGKSYGSSTASPASPQSRSGNPEVEQERARIEGRFTQIEATLRQWRDYMNQQERQQRLDASSMAWPDTTTLERLIRTYKGERTAREMWQGSVGIKSEEVRLLVEELEQQHPLPARSNTTAACSSPLSVHSPAPSSTSYKPTSTADLAARFDRALGLGSPGKREPVPYTPTPPPAAYPVQETPRSEPHAEPTPQYQETGPSAEDRDRQIREAADREVQDRIRKARERFNQPAAQAPAANSPFSATNPYYQASTPAKIPASVAPTSEAPSTDAFDNIFATEPVAAEPGPAERSTPTQESESWSYAHQETSAEPAAEPTTHSYEPAAPAESHEAYDYSYDQYQPQSTDYTSNALNVTTAPETETVAPEAVAYSQEPSAYAATESQPSWGQAFTNSLEKDWDDSSSSAFSSDDEDQGAGADSSLEAYNGTNYRDARLTTAAATSTSIPAPMDSTFEVKKTADAAFGIPVEPQGVDPGFDYGYDSDSSIIQEGGLSALLARMITNKMKAMEAHDSMDAPPPPPLPSTQQQQQQSEQTAE